MQASRQAGKQASRQANTWHLDEVGVDSIVQYTIIQHDEPALYDEMLYYETIILALLQMTTTPPPHSDSQSDSQRALPGPEAAAGEEGGTLGATAHFLTHTS